MTTTPMTVPARVTWARCQTGIADAFATDPYLQDKEGKDTPVWETWFPHQE
jgi:hypothetical protein